MKVRRMRKTWIPLMELFKNRIQGSRNFRERNPRIFGVGFILPMNEVIESASNLARVEDGGNICEIIDSDLNIRLGCIQEVIRNNGGIDEALEEGNVENGVKSR
jgi:hypothetical protein